MLNLPSPPTDNLYKFISIFGLVVAVLCVIYVETKSLELSQEITQLNSSKDQLRIEKLRLEQKRDNIRERIEDLDLKSKSREKTIVNDSIFRWNKVIAGPKELVDESKIIAELIVVLRENELDYSKKEIEINSAEVIINAKISESEKLFDWLDIILPIGFLTCILGFLLWYFKSQKFQDIILKEQYIQAQRNEYCQSCGIPLNRDLSYSEKKDEEKKRTHYCTHCFKDGSFTEPELTLLQMKNKLEKRCKELRISKLQIAIWKNDLEKLDRWRKKFYWI